MWVVYNKLVFGFDKYCKRWFFINYRIKSCNWCVGKEDKGENYRMIFVGNKFFNGNVEVELYSFVNIINGVVDDKGINILSSCIDNNVNESYNVIVNEELFVVE